MPQAFTIIPCQYSSHSSSSDRLVKFVTSYLWLHEDCVCWCIRPHTASHHPTSLTCASWSPPCQHDDRSARPPAATSWCQGHESSSATGHSRCMTGPEAWNSLPVDIRSTQTVTAFKSRLKIHLFKLSYCT